MIDRTRQAVQQRGLAAAGAAADQDVAAAARCNTEQGGTLTRHRLEADQLVERQAFLGKFSDRQCRAVEGQWRNDDADA